MASTFIMSIGTVSGLQLALPSIMQDFDVPVTTAVWVLLAYFVAIPGVSVAIGGISTHFEQRKLAVLGLCVDMFLMLIIFFTTSIYVFIVCRLLSSTARIFPWLILQVEGIGGFPPEQRGKAVGYSSAMTGLSMLLSLPLTGFVVDNAGWRYLFLGTSIAYALLIPLFLLLLPPMPPKNPGKTLRDFDLLGSFLMVGSVIALLTSLQLFARGLESGALPLVLGVGGLIGLLAFVWVELHAESPILQFSLFKIPGVSLAASQAAVLGFANGSFLLMLPFYFITGIGWTAANASQLLLFQNLMRPPAAPIAGRITDKWGTMAVVGPAATLAIISQVLLSQLGASPVVSILVLALTVWGTAQGLMMTTNLRQIYTSLPSRSLHLAPSVNISFSQLGNTSGQAFGSLAVERAQLAGVSGTLFVGALADSMKLVTLLFAAGMILTQVMPRLLLRSRMAPSNAAAAEAETETVAAGQARDPQS